LSDISAHSSHKQKEIPMANLDGTDKIVPTPYDAHEQVVRGPHTHSADEGYQPAGEYKPEENGGEKESA
jgi:hypothetical protein